jgi:hypothetical protein
MKTLKHLIHALSALSFAAMLQGCASGPASSAETSIPADPDANMMKPPLMIELHGSTLFCAKTVASQCNAYDVWMLK